MRSFINDRFKKSYKKLSKTERELAKKQYKLFRENPYHPSLHFKRVHSSLPIYSARVDRSIRVIGVLKDSIIIWFWIGNHSEYDKLLKDL